MGKWQRGGAQLLSRTHKHANTHSCAYTPTRTHGYSWRPYNRGLHNYYFRCWDSRMGRVCEMLGFDQKPAGACVWFLLHTRRRSGFDLSEFLHLKLVTPSSQCGSELFSQMLLKKENHPPLIGRSTVIEFVLEKGIHTHWKVFRLQVGWMLHSHVTSVVSLLLWQFLSQA